MAEEKDNWLDDVDDEENSSELDQSDIDSLLGDSAPPPLSANDGADDGALDGGDLDQSDIDSLLSGSTETSETPEAAQIDKSLDAGELDQSDIDNLFGDSAEADDTPEAESTDENLDAGELDQSDIDSLFGGDDEANQSDIDALLAEDSTPSGAETPDISPDQEEIDKLFSEMDGDEDENDPFQAEEIDFKDVIEEGADDDSFLTSGNGFGDDEFDLDDDMLNIPDIPADEEETTVFEGKEGSTSAPADSGLAAETADLEGSSAKPWAMKFNMPEIPIPPVLQERKNQAIAGGVLALLLLITVFIFSGDDESTKVAEEIPAEQQETVAPQPEEAPPATPNNAPVVTDSMLQLEPSTPLAIQLSAQDSEGDELQFELMTEPEHGALKGQAPYLIYIPNSDFPGEDMFHFRVTDGQNFSVPALVKITESLKTKIAQTPPPAAKKAETIKPRKLLISAQNLSYDIVGTENFFIDWEDVWDTANYLPYTRQVAVEILSNNLQGRLHKMSGNVHQYEAKKYVSGREEIRYRFKLGKLRSKIRKITLSIDAGEPAPKIVLQPIADFYKPGEQVLLDATASMDEERESLIFSWQQIAGVPIQMGVLNQEGSRVSFIVPSTFSTVKNPGPLMRVTAIDKSGKKDVQDIKIATISRHNNALWGSVAAGRL